MMSKLPYTVVHGAAVGAVDAGEPVGASGAGVGLSGQSAPALPVLADGAASGVHGKSLSSKWLIAKNALGQDRCFYKDKSKMEKKGVRM